MRCPNCDYEMEYYHAEPDVGILTGGYVCTTPDCETVINDVDLPDYDPNL